MKGFVDLFNEAMDLACLGVFEKKQLIERDGTFYSRVLKKSLDKFVLLNYTYMYNANKIFPSNETALIKMLSNDISDVIDNMPMEVS